MAKVCVADFVDLTFFCGLSLFCFAGVGVVRREAVTWWWWWWASVCVSPCTHFSIFRLTLSKEVELF